MEIDNLTVVNLTTKELTSVEISVLQLGLTFCPQNRLEYTQTRIDFFKFIRKLKLHKFFKMKPTVKEVRTLKMQHREVESLTVDDLTTLETLEELGIENRPDSDNSNVDIPTRVKRFGVDQMAPLTHFKPPSQFLPQMPLDAIDFFSEAVVKDLGRLRENVNTPIQRNLTSAQFKALENLQNDNNVVYKPSDKGGNIVVMSRTQYVDEALRQLQNSQCYELTNKESYQKSIVLYHDLINRWRDMGMLSMEESLFLRNSNPVTPTFYHLPKLHKDSKRPPGRPIVSSVGGLTENLSRFIDYFLSQSVRQLASYIKDSTDFINHISEVEWDLSYCMIVLDITSLYTCIEHQQGLDATRYFLQKRPLKYAQHNEMLLELMSFCLHNNIFLFQGDYYRQVSGTAMGTCFAPSYANLFVGWWEEQVSWAVTNEYWTKEIVAWHRYIDDLFIIWRGSIQKAKQYITFLNTNDVNLRFSGEISQDNVNYLDLKVAVEDGQLVTSLFRKETAGNSILHANSGHPPQLKNSIPYGEFLRIKRNCSTKKDCDIAINDSFKRFQARGYQTELLEKARSKVESIQRNSLLNKKGAKSDDMVNQRFRLITTYSYDSYKLRGILQRNWNLLKTDPVIGKDIPTFPLMTFRKARSLRDKLVHSHLDSTPNRVGYFGEIKGFFPCGKCKACVASKRTLTYQVKGVKGGKKIMKFLTCTTTHCVYCLRCPCGLRYVGSTIHSVKLRVLEHMRAISNKDANYPVARHFALKHNSNRNMLEYFAIDTISAHARGGDRILALRRLESRYIIDLNTKSPAGLNSGEEMSIHLDK